MIFLVVIVRGHTFQGKTLFRTGTNISYPQKKQMKKTAFRDFLSQGICETGILIRGRRGLTKFLPFSETA